MDLFEAIHAGQVPDPATGAVMPPIYQVSTYRQPGLGAGWVYDYARTINPTRGALERNLDIAVERLNPQTFDFSLAALDAKIAEMAAIVLAGLVAVSALGNSAYFGVIHAAPLDWTFLGPAALVRLFALSKTLGKYGERVVGHRAALLDQDRVVLAHAFVSVCASGRVKRMVRPPSALLAAHSLPPWLSMIERLTDSPMPMPSPFVV